jgi:hypothetical protein
MGALFCYLVLLNLALFFRKAQIGATDLGPPNLLGLTLDDGAFGFS